MHISSVCSYFYASLSPEYPKRSVNFYSLKQNGGRYVSCMTPKNLDATAVKCSGGLFLKIRDAKNCTSRFVTIYRFTLSNWHLHLDMRYFIRRL